MPKRISTPKKTKAKRPTDFNQLAHQLVNESTQPKPDQAGNEFVREFMRQMGSKGGKIGGKRRLETMTAEQRSAAALKAARVRWAKK